MSRKHSSLAYSAARDFKQELRHVWAGRTKERNGAQHPAKARFSLRLIKTVANAMRRSMARRERLEAASLVVPFNLDADACDLPQRSNTNSCRTRPEAGEARSRLHDFGLGRRRLFGKRPFVGTLIARLAKLRFFSLEKSMGNPLLSDHPGLSFGADGGAGPAAAVSHQAGDCNRPRSARVRWRPWRRNEARPHSISSHGSCRLVSKAWWQADAIRTVQSSCAVAQPVRARHRGVMRRLAPDSTAR